MHEAKPLLSYCIDCHAELDIPLGIMVEAELERREQDIDVLGFLCDSCEKNVE